MRPAAEDSELMVRYRDGDVAAFEMLYRKYNDSLYRYLLRLSRNHETAADVFQDAWSNVIKSRDRYRPTAKFSTYLYRVARNCFIDHLRRNKRHDAAHSIDADQHAAPVDDPEASVEMSLAHNRFREALDSLPQEQRDVFLLHEEAGLSLDCIADVTGANRETVKSRLRYAIKKLKTSLAVSFELSEPV